MNAYELARIRGEAIPARYRVDGGAWSLASLIVDTRTHESVLSLGGPDRFALAGQICELLNNSPTETPVTKEAS